MKVLVTGAAGFIGSAVSLALFQRGDDVTGIDNLSEYYDVALKQARLDRIKKALRAFHAVGASNTGMFRFLKIDLTDRLKMESLFATQKFDAVINLAAQPGDVPDTFADVRSLVADFGYQPGTSLKEGVEKFVVWYREYYAGGQP